MDIEEFYKKVEKVSLFPGSVDDLNKLAGLREAKDDYGMMRVHFKLMALVGQKHYLTGIVIPTPDEILILNDELASHRKVMAAVAGNTAKMRESTELLEQLTVEQISFYPEIMETDIRMKALKIGASGLVHFQKYGDEFPGTYMGAPVYKWIPQS